MTQTASTQTLSGFPFRKMNGLGNDFVILDLRAGGRRPREKEARAIGDRETGVGCDQIITIEPSKHAGAFMGVWNADGSEVGACGNAARCVGWLLMEENGGDTVRIDTRSGVIVAMRAGEQRVAVDMGPPRLAWEEIPLAERMDTRGIDVKLGPIDAPVLQLPGAVSMGNPHCIFFVDDVDAHDLKGVGPLVEGHMLFPERTNVGLAQISAPDYIRLRVWERGAGITKACGTAACAAVVAAVRRNLSARKATVELDGGPLDIEWRDANDHVMMTGDVAFEFDGRLP